MEDPRPEDPEEGPRPEAARLDEAPRKEDLQDENFVAGGLLAESCRR